MNTKTAPESCPFCGAGKKRHLPHIAFRWFECGTMTAPAKTPRRDQTPACADAERERLTQERDEARAERDDLLARIKRLEEATQDRDKEWFQVIESILGFHPVSITDALRIGIERIKKQKQRIKRLEQAGDELATHALAGGVPQLFMEFVENWHKAKEAKP